MTRTNSSIATPCHAVPAAQGIRRLRVFDVLGVEALLAGAWGVIEGIHVDRSSPDYNTLDSLISLMAAAQESVAACAEVFNNTVRDNVARDVADSLEGHFVRLKAFTHGAIVMIDEAKPIVDFVYTRKLLSMALAETERARSDLFEKAVAA